MNSTFPQPLPPEAYAPAATPRTAMVFAAGLGARMKPLTLTTPKPLVKVGGKALIDHSLDDFARIGVTRAIVNVHHLADALEAHLASRTAPQIIVSDERSKLLDQGGGIKKILPLIGEDPFFICNTDAFWLNTGSDNLRALARLWNADDMDAALLLASTQGNVGVDWDGDFDLDASGRIIRANGVKPYVYSGVGIIRPQLFNAAQDDVFKLAPYFFEAAAKGRLFGVAARGLWLHVGTVAAIGEAERAIAARLS